MNRPTQAVAPPTLGRDDELRELIDDVHVAALNLDLMAKRARATCPALAAPHRGMCVATLRLVRDVLRDVGRMLDRDRAETRGGR